MGRKRPSVFVGSSKEGLEIAKVLQLLLDHSCEVTIWSQGVFGLSQGTLESLVEASKKFDFAILVLTGDDLITARNQTGSIPRDNVLFELGLFMGGLGRDRTFIVYDRTASLKLPSDLAGVTPATFEPHVSGNLESSLGAPSTRIERAIRTLGLRSKENLVNGGAGVKRIQDGYEIERDRIQIRVKFGRIEEASSSDSDCLVVLPANEYFDDECINDTRSALGAFIQHHFQGYTAAVRNEIQSKLASFITEQVEKEHGRFANSFGIGTCAYLERSLSSPFQMAMVSVTTKRAGEGLRAKPRYILDAIAAVHGLMVDRRLSRLYIPLLGGGHGGIHPEVSLNCMLVGLWGALRSPSGHHLKSVDIIVYRATPTSAPEVSEEVVERSLSSVYQWFS